MDPTRRRILDRLLDRPATGPELARELSITRAAVWKHVEALREEGIEITSTDDGYSIQALPEYGEAAVAAGIPGTFDVYYQDSMPSTNDRAREVARTTDGESIVLADAQPAGRGRLGREWAGPAGGIYLSLLLRPDLAPTDVPILTTVAGVSVAETIGKLGLDPAIKWPNDVLIGDRKVAGILTEMQGEADRVDWVIVGIGINANVDPDALPDGASSLQAVIGDPVERRQIVHWIVERIDRYRNDPSLAIDQLRKWSATVGRQVRIETPAGTVEGLALDVVHPGALVVKTDSGEEIIHAGDCEHLRDDDGSYPHDDS